MACGWHINCYALRYWQNNLYLSELPGIVYWGSYHPNLSSQSSHLRFGIFTIRYKILSFCPQDCSLYSEAKIFSVSKALKQYDSASFIQRCSKTVEGETHVASLLIFNLHYFDILVSSHPQIYLFHFLSLILCPQKKSI